MAERCERCGKPFTGRSKPHWVFTADVKPLGLMHAGCAATANPHRPGTEASVATEQEAQFIAWTDLAKNDDEEASPRTYALIMSWAVHPSLDQRFLSQNQLDWLKRYPADRQRVIREAYAQLLDEYREWQAARA